MSAEQEWLSTLRPSRIREVQAGAAYWTSVDLVDCDGLGESIRGVLEQFGVRVVRWKVGQARHLAQALREGREPYLLLSCHGDEGSILLDELAPEVQRWQPFGPRVGADDIAGFTFAGTTVIATGCDTGDEALAAAFLGAGAAAYLAPEGGPFGYASVFAPLLLFYEMTERRSFDQAVAKLQDHDPELAMWRLYRPPPP